MLYTSSRACITLLIALLVVGPGNAWNGHRVRRHDQLATASNNLCAVTSIEGQYSSKDDTDAILSALQNCNNGGKVVLDGNYTIASPLKATDLVNIEIEITGTVRFGNTLEYWQNNSLYVSRQANMSYTLLGGINVTIHGTGTIDGNGQHFYDAYGTQADSLVRPHLLAFKGLQRSRVSGLRLVNSPQWFIVVEESKNVIFDSLDMHAENGTGTGKAASNTDGVNFHRSDDMIFRNMRIINGDDCVALKANSTNILVENLDCTTLEGGSGGLSVGSLGQFPDEYEIVQNVVFRRCHIKAAETAMRIKTWPDRDFAASFHLHGGGGSGLVQNITWQDITVEEPGVAIDINQCYGVWNKSLCPQESSRVAIRGAMFINIKGKTSTKKDPYAGNIVCSHRVPCKGVVLDSFNVEAPKGRRNVFACANIDAATSRMAQAYCASSFIDVRGEGKDKWTVQPPIQPGENIPPSAVVR